MDRERPRRSIVEIHAIRQFHQRTSWGMLWGYRGGESWWRGGLEEVAFEMNCKAETQEQPAAEGRHWARQVGSGSHHGTLGHLPYSTGSEKPLRAQFSGA